MSTDVFDPFALTADDGVAVPTPAAPVVTGERSLAMTAAQRRVFDELLIIGGQRPVARDGFVDELRARVTAGTAEAVARWSEPTLWLSKSQLFTALRCEGQLAADRAAPRRTTLHPATAIGIVAHRAIQIAYTHQGQPVSTYVHAAVDGALTEEKFADYWAAVGISEQSDLMAQATNQVTAFLDSWPALDPLWNPRFETSFQARIGGLILAARADLVLGRPRPDNRQTMVVVDLKTSSLGDHHFDEAMFYALVATLRNGVPPWRSTVYSLASGDWTDADVTEQRLEAAAETVITAVRSVVDTLTESRPLKLAAGTHCSWCPVKSTCGAYATWQTDAATAATAAASAPTSPGTGAVKATGATVVATCCGPTPASS